MNRLTITNEILDEINFEVPSDKEGSYNILDIAKYSDEEEMQKILLNIVDRLVAYEDTGLEPHHIDDILGQLLGYLDAEQAGLLIELPCKVDDTVYQIMYDRTIENYKVVGFEIDERGKLFVRVLIERPAATIKLSYRKEDLFLTREEAEKALEAQNEL